MLHDRGRADAARSPPPNTAERAAAADPMGAVRVSAATAVLRSHLDRSATISNGRSISSVTSCRSRLLAGLSFALAVLLPAARPADRPDALPPVRCRIRHQPFGELRPDHARAWPRSSRATADALKQIVYNYYGNTNSEGPIIFAAALATILVNPIQERVQRWSEKSFQRNLFLLRDELPTASATCAKRRPSAKCSTRSWLASIGRSRAYVSAADRSTAAFSERADCRSRRSRRGGPRCLRAGLSSAKSASRRTSSSRSGSPCVPSSDRRRADRLSAGRAASRRIDPEP